MSKTGLLIVDLQNDYFPDGKQPLTGIEQASEQAKAILELFRERELPVIHVRHENPSGDGVLFVKDSEGAKIHSMVAPLESECVIVKRQINSFLGTELKQLLDEKQLDKLVIMGAMIHMCIDAATRAAADYGYSCMLVHDACATLELEFMDLVVPADHVHGAFMNALTSYAEVVDAQTLIQKLRRQA